MAYIARKEHPRCDMTSGHTGPHRADRGMTDALWTETFHDAGTGVKRD